MQNASLPLRRRLLVPPLSQHITRLSRRRNTQCFGTEQRKQMARNGQGKEPGKDEIDLDALLAKPTWSVSTLLPPADQASQAPPITSKRLHHLLRLSALPPPSSAQEEKSMMDTLAAQLHFVREMQKVDTTNVEPLRAIRDETLKAQKEQEITLDTLRDALSKEEIVGEHYKRVRRRSEPHPMKKESANWDPLSHAQRTAGKFFVVDGGKTME